MPEQNRKQLVMDTLLHHRNAVRPPWVPFAGVHAGSLAGYSANEMLQNAAQLSASVLKAYEAYDPDGLPVVFDLQLEAEAIGCKLFWDENGKVPPTVLGHPLEKEKYIPCDCTIPTADSGRFPIVLESMRTIKEKIGHQIALYGLICGPFTLASHLRGPMLFMDMYDDPHYVSELLTYCSKVCHQITNLYLKAGMDVIAYVDPLLSQISSDHIEEFVQPHYQERFCSLRKKGVPSCLFVCGDVSHNVETLCKMEPDCLSVDENVDIQKAQAICQKYGVVIGGNIQLTLTMLHGNTQDNMKEVVEIIDRCDPKDLIVSPGCDMPYDVPIENGIACARAVHDYESIKAVLKDYDPKLDVSNLPIKIPKYEHLERPLVEVFTLDSRTCAACTYTLNTVKSAHQGHERDFDYREYRFTDLEGIAQIKAMGVEHLPSIYINGRCVYSSLIPTTVQLLEAIDKARIR